VDFLLVLIGLFSLGVTAEALRTNINWKLAILLEWGRLAQNFGYKGSFPTDHSSCRKTRINVLSYGISIWAQVSCVLSQCTRLTDRQTERKAFAIPCVVLHADTR